MEHSLDTALDCMQTIAIEAKKAKCVFISRQMQSIHDSLKKNKELAEKYNTPVLKKVCLRIIENITLLERTTDKHDKDILKGLIEFDFNALLNSLPAR